MRLHYATVTTNRLRWPNDCTASMTICTENHWKKNSDLHIKESNETACSKMNRFHSLIHADSSLLRGWPTVLFAMVLGTISIYI